jgi:hypothetical protein
MTTELYWFYWETDGRRQPYALRAKPAVSDVPYWVEHADDPPFDIGRFRPLSDSPMTMTEGDQLGMSMIKAAGGRWFWLQPPAEAQS